MRQNAALQALQAKFIKYFFRFKVSVNTEPHTHVQFYLVYEELLSRVSGRYQYTVNINPQLKLSSYSVGVSITEMSDITHISVNRLSYKRGPESKEATGDNHINEEEEVEGAEIMMSPTNPGKVTVNYAPNVKTLQHELRHEKHPLQVNQSCNEHLRRF